MKYIMVEHTIVDREKFDESLYEAMIQGGSHEGFSLLKVYLSEQETKCFCIWEAPSIDELKKMVEPVNKECSNNEYWVVGSFVPNMHLL